MKKLFLAPVFFFVPIFLSGVSSGTFAEAPKKVLWVPFEGTVELGLSPFIERAIDYAEKNQFDALVLEMDTFGGRVDAAVAIRDRLLDTNLLTAVWVNKRAISAGALVSLACKKIYFSPGSTMGAATPIQMAPQGEAQQVENKVVSYFRAEMGATAERHGRDRKIAEAMVLATDDIKGLIKKGDVLTLTDKTAVEAKISDGTVSSRAEVLEKLGLPNAQVENFTINWAEKIVRFLTDPTVSGLLMSAGVLGIIFELQTPGFGLPGILGITALALFFGGKFIVELAGWEEVLFLLAGIALIVVEVFVLPGFFIFGALGFILMLAALFMAGISPKIPFDFEFPTVQMHLNSVAFAFVLMMVGMVALYHWIWRKPRKMALVLDSELTKAEGYSSFTDAHQDLIGKTGRALTALRPAGKAEIEGRRIEVVTSGEFINAEEPLRVVSADEMKIVVARVAKT